MFGYIDSIFGGIKCDSHVNYCTYKNNLYQIISVCTFGKITGNVTGDTIADRIAQSGASEKTQHMAAQLLSKDKASAETAEIAAQKAGFGNPETYRQAKQVIEQGAESPIEKIDSILNGTTLHK